MENNIYIFGVHSRAQTLAEYLHFLYPNMAVKAYFYDNDEKNPEKIGKIPVLRLDSSADFCTDYPVYIGTRGIYHPQITKKLKQIGFKTIYPVTQEFDLELRNQYLEKYYESVGRKFLKLDKLTFRETERSNRLFNRISASVYVVKSPFDKPLQQSYSLAPYEKEIYAGAVFSESLLPENTLRDDIGKNISDKNKQFCELTALYWIWKHAQEEIVGVAHYRRHFLLPEDWKERILEQGIDVILPVPLYVAPDIEENFKSRHDPLDWEFMMQCLEETDISLYPFANHFFKGNLYSPCNMFIMKKPVLDELCSWMFPLLFKIAEHGGWKEDPYLNRYPGFISERLISLFFEKNRERFNVVYCDKNFLP